MPRLTGTVVAREDRQAIFSSRGGLPAVAVGEGEQIGGFDVVSISAGRVELRCNSERYHVTPLPDREARQDSTAQPLPAPLLPATQAQSDNDK